MRMYDLIMKKRNGGILTEEEIQFMVSGYTQGQIPDYQMSAMMMAVYFQGMTETETTALTMAMAHSAGKHIPFGRSCNFQGSVVRVRYIVAKKYAPFRISKRMERGGKSA